MSDVPRSPGAALRSSDGLRGELAGPAAVHRDDAWLRTARWARWLAWVSLGWMTVEGAVGLAAGVSAGSIALVGWALSSVVEGLASVIVIWRFTGARTLSESAEARAQKAVAFSFWLLAPYVAIESIHDLLIRHQPGITLLGIGLTISSLALMPALGIVKQRLGARLGSGATAGEGAQNLLCASLAAAVLAGLAANALWGWWWLDPIVGLAVAAVAVREGVVVWRGESCCAAPGLVNEDGCGCGPGCTDASCARETRREQSRI
jgi:divalent metal cation (Fe/Co/Zn/Cd) transporter